MSMGNDHICERVNGKGTQYQGKGVHYYYMSGEKTHIIYQERVAIVCLEEKDLIVYQRKRSTLYL